MRACETKVTSWNRVFLNYVLDSKRVKSYSSFLIGSHLRVLRELKRTFCNIVFYE